MDHPVILSLIAAYLLGSVPAGLLFSRLLTGLDPRNAGSRNIGFTNVLRSVGLMPAALTLIADMLKGWLPVWWTASFLSGPERWGVGLAAVAGHAYPVFLRFKGGKGVATGLGAVLGLDPLVATALVSLWTVILAVWRYVSLASVSAVVVMPLMLWTMGRSPSVILLSGCFSVLIVLRHRDNLLRLRSGTEHRWGKT
jgi:glycerol-3-phosphate acyltransferase PlsY